MLIIEIAIGVALGGAILFYPGQIATVGAIILSACVALGALALLVFTDTGNTIVASIVAAYILAWVIRTVRNPSYQKEAYEQQVSLFDYIRRNRLTFMNHGRRNWMWYAFYGLIAYLLISYYAR